MGILGALGFNGNSHAFVRLHVKLERLHVQIVLPLILAPV